jgi:hypothetical protein
MPVPAGYLASQRLFRPEPPQHRRTARNSQGLSHLRGPASRQLAMADARFNLAILECSGRAGSRQPWALGHGPNTNPGYEPQEKVPLPMARAPNRCTTANPTQEQPPRKLKR